MVYVTQKVICIDVIVENDWQNEEVVAEGKGDRRKQIMYKKLYICQPHF